MVIALEVIKTFALISRHHVAHILLGMDVADADIWVVGDRLIANRMNQVGFTETHAAVQEKRVVRTARVTRHLNRGGTR